MDKYFDIHITYGDGDGDGYSIPVIAKNEEEAVQKAIEENLFEYEEDVNEIDYIEELSKEEYYNMVSYSEKSCSSLEDKIKSVKKDAHNNADALEGKNVKISIER